MDAAEVLEFWFGQDRKRWFVKEPAFDDEIRTRFLSLYEKAFKGNFTHWKAHGRGCLALVILFDQFPRNMFRGAARAFSSDAMALACASLIIDNGWDKTMTPDERSFVYLPFEHSESLEHQIRCCELMAPLGEELLRYAVRHREIIERFGRFPHRNAMLGRQSTPEEIEFLKQPGSRF